MTQTYLIGAPDDLSKAVSIAQLPDSAFTWYTPHVSQDEVDTKARYQAVPWLNRGVTLRAQAVASLPFALYQGDTEYDISAQWENKVGFLPNPSLLLWLIEAALTVLGKAYLFRVQGTQTGKVKALKYLVPSTIEPAISESAGLMGFTRLLGANTFKLRPDQLVYFWQPDLYVELGPPESCPAKAAMQAAGVLYNVDQFAEKFFERGAIKATLLTVANNPPESEKAKLKSWWQRVISGISQAWTTEVVSADVEPRQIGEGIQELADSELTREKREDISTALGIPQTLLWSSSATGLGGGGVVTQDEKHFLTKTVVPEAEFIQAVLNQQLFGPMGFRWSFLPETLDAFKEDEQARAQAFALYVQNKIPASWAAEMLGLELPQGKDYEDLERIEEERRELAAEAFGGGGPPRPQEQESNLPPGAKSDLRRWKTVALKAVKSGSDPNEREFRSDTIPEDIYRHIRAMLDGAQTEEEVKAAFAAPFPAGAWDGYP